MAQSGTKSHPATLVFPRESSWFARDPSKAYFERFSLTWTPISLVFLLGGVFGTGLWRHCGRDEYLGVSVVACVPGIVWPIMFPSPADAGRPYSQRFWVKAGVWIAVFSFYGNYFWTHYFYTLLGAQYLFESYTLNNVPLVTYLCTYFYFTFYFSLTNVVLRCVSRALGRMSFYGMPLSKRVAFVVWALSIFLVAVLTAVFEAVSIQHFPLYSYTDKFSFLTIGSVVYGIYFMVGFPMFFALDETPAGNYGSKEYGKAANDYTSPGSKQPNTPPCSLWYTLQNALAAVAIVTLLLDLWRLFIGDIYSFKSASTGVPFIYQSESGNG